MPYISFLLVWPCLVNFPNIILYIIIVKSYLMHHTNMHISNFSTLFALATGSHIYYSIINYNYILKIQKIEKNIPILHSITITL